MFFLSREKKTLPWKFLVFRSWKKIPSREKVLETAREKSTVPVKFPPNPTRENEESGREKNPPHSANFFVAFLG